MVESENVTSTETPAPETANSQPVAGDRWTERKPAPPAANPYNRNSVPPAGAPYNRNATPPRPPIQQRSAESYLSIGHYRTSSTQQHARRPRGPAEPFHQIGRWPAPKFGQTRRLPIPREQLPPDTDEVSPA